MGQVSILFLLFITLGSRIIRRVIGAGSEKFVIATYLQLGRMGIGILCCSRTLCFNECGIWTSEMMSYYSKDELVDVIFDAKFDINEQHPQAGDFFAACRRGYSWSYHTILPKEIHVQICTAEV